MRYKDVRRLYVIKMASASLSLFLFFAASVVFAQSQSQPGSEDEWLTFLNSDLGLLLVALGAIGLFTWQRVDWLSKQKYLRAQVMLDRRIQLMEGISADAGTLVAADSVIAVIQKRAADDQRSKVIDLYNTEQAKWFGVTAAHQALVGLYYPANIPAVFKDGVLEATRCLDVKVYEYTTQDTDDNQQKSI